MKGIAFVVGIAAVVLYLLGYLQKKRNAIITFNLSSRILYIVQYFLLGAFEGAALDICGSISSVLAQNKDKKYLKKALPFVFAGVNLGIIAVGLLLYVNIFSLLPIIGVLLHTSAFWISNERSIRIVSLLGCPFWLLYNFASGAYGSCIGDILSMMSIGISMIRYDALPKRKTAEKKTVKVEMRDEES